MRGIIIAPAVALMLLVFPASAHAQSWKVCEVSYYGNFEGEYYNCDGSRFYDSFSMGVAVPMEQRVTMKAWRKHYRKNDTSWLNTHFYIGERIRLRHKKGGRTYYATATVRDVGGFGSYGRKYKGKRIPRQFDLQPAVKRKLRAGGLDVVSWKWVR